MLMNHRRRTDSAYIEYRATIDTSPGLKPLTPYWLRVTGCRSARDPIFTVPGGARRGALDRRAGPFGDGAARDGPRGASPPSPEPSAAAAGPA
jgi:hypothetical protein